MACELGQRFSLAFDECSALIEQFRWYLFPADVQRMLPVILNFTQQPIDKKCFGSVAADREAFKYVRVSLRDIKIQLTKKNKGKTNQFKINVFQIMKTAFSYFTILRQFY